TAVSQYTASVWVKGAGSLELQFWGDSSWAKKLASAKVSAGSTWTKVTTPVFNVGSRSRIYLTFDTAYSSTAGTMYLDEVFVGTSGGTNRVSNPGFEGGNTSWNNDAPAIFSIKNAP
ncbi:MAG: hypothetical protein WCG52_01210, partial [bacterium]